ncbi:hypothetical protein [Halobacteriovorax sp. CON-3]|uniref:hypothetical protein n=1 Tax=Halobacteriovorax sp. CON-3 TaxID=3157710 RepID=UPI003714044E
MVAGFLGVISILFASTFQQSSRAQKRAVASMEKYSLSTRIAQILREKDSCTNSIGPGKAIFEGAKLNSFKNRKGATVLETQKKYGGSTMTIDDIELSEIETNVDPEGKKYGELEVLVKFKDVSKTKKGKRVDLKKYPIRISLDEDDSFIACASDTESAVIRARIESCKQLKGDFDLISKTCVLVDFSLAPVEPPSLYEGVSTQYLEDYRDQILENLYVNENGDTMTGELNTLTGLCIKGNCRRTFVEQLCPSGHVISDVNSDGTVKCANVTCPDPATFYIGISSNGTPICKAFPSTTCNTNQYVDQVNEDGSVVCRQLPPGTNKSCLPGAIGRIDPDGNHECSKPQELAGKSCPIGFANRGLDSNGNILCEELNGSPKLMSCRWMGRKSADEGDWGRRYCPSGYSQHGIYFKTGVATGTIKEQITESMIAARHDGNWFTKDIEYDVRCCTLVIE